MADIAHSVRDYSVCGTMEFDNPDHLLDLFEKISSVDRPHLITNQITEIDQEEPLESEIHFGLRGESDPRNSDENNIQVNVWEMPDDVEEENQLHIHLHSDPEHAENLADLYISLASIVGGIQVGIFTSWVEFDIDFDELDLGLELDLPENISYEKVTGFRFDVEQDPDTDILMQRSADSTLIRYSVENPTMVEGSEEATFIDDPLKDLSSLVQELAK